jgi:hypothetical protein
MMPCNILWTIFALTLLTASGTLAGAESYQPTGNVTRGIYARIDAALGTSVWQNWGSGFTFVNDQVREGRSCIRCVGRAGERGQGGQRIELNQTEPRRVKIAGWSRSENVPGEKATDIRSALISLCLPPAGSFHGCKSCPSGCPRLGEFLVVTLA